MRLFYIITILFAANAHDLLNRPNLKPKFAYLKVVPFPFAYNLSAQSNLLRHN